MHKTRWERLKQAMQANKRMYDLKRHVMSEVEFCEDTAKLQQVLDILLQD